MPPRTVQRLAGNRAAAAMVHDVRADRAPANLVGAALSGTGAELSPELGRAMGRWFGSDFSDVRVHQGPAADEAARTVDAEAFTVGRDIVFARGRYAPDTDAGRYRLAHELSHVVQQQSGPVNGVVGADGLRVSTADDRFEREAESVARSMPRLPQARGTVHRAVQAQAQAHGPAAPAGRVTLQRCGSTPAEECSCHGRGGSDTVQRQAKSVAGGSASSVAGTTQAIARPTSLPLDQGFVLYALPGLLAEVVAGIPEGQLSTLTLVQPFPGSVTARGAEAFGTGSASALVAGNAQLRAFGLPGSAAAADTIGIAAIPRMNLTGSPFSPQFSLPDPAAGMSLWGHTVVYVRQGGRIVAVRGFNPDMGFPTGLIQTMVKSRGIEAGTAEQLAVLSEDAYLFTSNAARTLEFPVAPDKAAAFLADLPAAGPGGRAGVPRFYTARPSIWAAGHPGVPEPFCVASNCGLWALGKAEDALGGPIGRPGQGSVTALGTSSTPAAPGTGGQGQLIALLEEANAAQAAGKASGLAEVPGATGAAVAARVPTVFKVVKIGGRVMLLVGIAAGVAEIALATPRERPRVAAGVAGGFGGGLALGATAGLFCGPGALVCSIVAGLVLGTIGALGGRAFAESLYGEAHRQKRTDEYPGHSVVCPSCHDNSATRAAGFRVLAPPGPSGPQSWGTPMVRTLSDSDRQILLNWLADQSGQRSR